MVNGRNNPNPITRIGIYDSGVGGLTVLDPFEEAFPGIQFVYYGDTAFMPYGEKSPEFIADRTRRMIDWLINEQHVEAVAIGCNSSAILREDPGLVADFLAWEASGIRVVDPITAAGQTVAQLMIEGQYQEILLLATQVTVDSGKYQAVLKAVAPEINLTTLACPGLAQATEQLGPDHPKTQEIMAEVLAPLAGKTFDAVILGCTHYAFLTHHFARLLPPWWALINPAQSMVDCVRTNWPVQGAMDGHSMPNVSIYVSGDTHPFLQTVRKLPLKSVNIGAVHQLVL